METKFNFNSQVCTSKIQSERLLALGLKRETADMVWLDHAMTEEYNDWKATPVEEWDDWNKNDIPAWSLHRLIEMYDGWVDVGGIGISTARGVFNGKDNTYDNLIDAIEYEIKWYDFNKEYLV